MDCWVKKLNDRPSFTEIVKTISNYTEVIAGYLDINFNPFCAPSDSIVTQFNPHTNSQDDEKDILLSELLINKLHSCKTKSIDKKSKCDESPKVSPTVSRKVSQNSSPSKQSSRVSSIPSPSAPSCTSLLSSPLLKLRKMEDDRASTASNTTFITRIEILVESPSEEEV